MSKAYLERLVERFLVVTLGCPDTILHTELQVFDRQALHNEELVTIGRVCRLRGLAGSLR